MKTLMLTAALLLTPTLAQAQVSPADEGDCRLYTEMAGMFFEMRSLGETKEGQMRTHEEHGETTNPAGYAYVTALINFIYNREWPEYSQLQKAHIERTVYKDCLEWKEEG